MQGARKFVIGIVNLGFLSGVFLNPTAAAQRTIVRPDGTRSTVGSHIEFPASFILSAKEPVQKVGGLFFTHCLRFDPVRNSIAFSGKGTNAGFHVRPVQRETRFVAEFSIECFRGHGQFNVGFRQSRTAMDDLADASRPHFAQEPSGLFNLLPGVNHVSFEGTAFTDRESAVIAICNSDCGWRLLSIAIKKL